MRKVSLDGLLTVDVLSGVAAFSSFHFHRQFSALFGISIHRHVQLNRLKRAVYRLAFRAEHSITEIAYDSGYETPESFSRALDRAEPKRVSRSVGLAVLAHGLCGVQHDKEKPT